MKRLLMHGWKRFPITFVYLAGYLVWEIIFSIIRHAPVYYYPIPDITTSLGLLLSTGVGLTLAINIWCEQFGLKKFRNLLQIIGNMALWIGCGYLVFNYSWLRDSSFIVVMAIETTITVAVFFVPIYKKQSETRQTVFSLIQLRNFLYSAGISIGLVNVVYIILFLSSNLTDTTNIADGLNILFVVPVIAGMLLFIVLVPTPKQTANRERYRFRLSFFSLLCDILLAIAVLGAIPLYYYSIKCLIDQSLPQISDCFWMIIFIVYAYFVIFMLKSSELLFKGLNMRQQTALKYMPVVVLPVLIMAGISVIYQISHYGISIARLYAATFVLWGMITMIYIFITNARRLITIPLSFACVFLLTTIIPGANYAYIVKRYMNAEIIHILEYCGVSRTELPLTLIEYEEIKTYMDPGSREDLWSYELYLRSNYTNDVLDNIVVNY